MKAAVILLAIVFISGFALADTEYYGSEFGIESYEVTDWSDPVNFTVSNETDGSTEYFGSELTIQGATNDTGGGWLLQDTASIIVYFILFGILLLFPLAFIVKYRNGRKFVRR